MFLRASRVVAETALRDICVCVRGFCRNAGFFSVAVATIALGIGSATAVFCVAHSILLTRLPFAQSDRLVTVAEKDISSPGIDRISYVSARAYVQRGSTVEGIALYSDGGGGRYVENGASEMLRGQRVSPNFFSVLGVAPLLGRTFVAEDALPGGNDVIILGFGLWQRVFGADPHVIGRLIPVNDRLLRIVGVLRPDFHPFHMSNPGEIPQVFSPTPSEELESNRLDSGATAIARLNPGVTLAAARADLSRIRTDLVREYPSASQRTSNISVRPLRERMTGAIRAPLLMLLVAVIFVLLIACANLTNLLLARTSGRSTEIALRVALGCGRWRLARQFVTESALLSACGGIAGVLLAWWGVRALAAAAPAEIPRLDEVQMDGAVLWTALAAIFASGLVSGLVPAIGQWRTDVHGTLRFGRDSAGGRRDRSVRNTVVTIQIAAAFVLAVGASLLGHTLQQLLDKDAGYDPHHILTMTTFAHDFTSDDQKLTYYRQLVKRVSTLPGVESAAMISSVPLSASDQTMVTVEHTADRAAAQARVVDIAYATPEYFRLMRIPLVTGRVFNDHDGPPSPPVAVISRTCAKLLFGGESAVGRRIQIDRRAGVWILVAGVVGDVWQHGMDDGPSAGIYIPQAQEPVYWYRLLVRTFGAPWHIYPSVRAVIHELNPREPMFHVQPMDDYVMKSIASRIFAFSLIGMLGALALALAGVGIYGVISYAVGQRTREFGIRVALGASRAAVVRIVLKDVALMLVTGIGIGFIIAFVLRRFVAHMLYHVEATDPASTLTAALILSAVAVVAACVPCRRAMQMDAATALRHD